MEAHTRYILGVPDECLHTRLVLVVPNFSSKVVRSRNKIGLIGSTVVVQTVHSFVVADESEVGLSGAQLPHLDNMLHDQKLEILIQLLCVNGKDNL